MSPKTDKEKQEIGEKKQIVLVVDGRPVRQFYTSIFLQRLKYHVIMAKTADDALTFMNLTIPLVVIVNIDLPDIGGVDLLKTIKKKRRTRDVPVIIYTSNKDVRLEEACGQAGCSAFLRHPATLEELYVAVQKATDRPRRFVRLDTFLDVSLDDGNNPFRASDRKSSIAAISELGMFVTVDDPPSFGSIHTFNFHLPNAPGWVIRAEGQVVYCKNKDGKQGIGVKFTKIGNQEREFIKDFIRSKLMEGISPERKLPQ